MIPFCEIGARSNFSLLEGASKPEEMVTAAAASGLSELFDGEPLPAAGVGLRYQASEAYGVNVSVDYAVGRDDGALYFRIGEAF